MIKLLGQKVFIPLCVHGLVFKKSQHWEDYICRLCRGTFVADMLIKVTFFIIRKQNMLTNEEFSRMHFSSNKRSFQSSVKRDSTMQTSLHESLTTYCPSPCLNFNLHHQLNGFPSVQHKNCAMRLCLTHRVQQNSEEELSPIDELVQFVRTARVVFIEDSVCEKATCLPGQHLWYKQIQNHEKRKKNKYQRNAFTNKNALHQPSAESGAQTSVLQAVTPLIVCFQ